MDDIEKVIAACHHDPAAVLGAHFGTPDSDQVTVRTYQPDALRVEFVHNGQSRDMQRIGTSGMFSIIVPQAVLSDRRLPPFTYQFKVHFPGQPISLTNDPYRFAVQLGELDRHLFSQGTNYRIYEHLGAHCTEVEHVSGVIFRVWAPNAKGVSVIGNFNSWDHRIHQMRVIGSSGIWEIFIPHLGRDEIYKFSVLTKQGERIDKSDPFQFYGELRPATGSIIHSTNNFNWTDNLWQQQKTRTSPYPSPMIVYEVHPGSWQRDPAAPDRFFTFLELADKLIPYVKHMGFTHIELLPVMEHPLDESWGYQVAAPFSLTSRYGTPEEFQEFVNRAHASNIGVILDWVPAHFPKDAHSLGNFDGTALYEHADHRRGSHPQWGTYIYNYGRREVSNYLISNALFWIEKYHIDGLRVDAVASMLYLDYARDDGDWLPNRYGGKENLEAIEFLRHLNSIVYEKHPNCLMIAEESTSFYGVSRPADHGGLGFGFKWNMGWMNDILDYFSRDPVHRKYHHNNLTFSLMYAFSENFILPLSHDEVVHGKRSMLNKMFGDRWQKFANQRLLFLFMWMHPGKKLIFMGMEFGQWNEWYCKRSLDWHLLDDACHRQLQTYVQELNGFYLENSGIWERDFDHEGFSWLDFHDRDNSVISFARFGRDRDNHLICILNFTPNRLDNYQLGLVSNQKYRIIFSSDQEKYGGTGRCDCETLISPIPAPGGGADYHASLTIPPLGGLVLKPEGQQSINIQHTQ
ncbi:1,4-alpha-glucan branching protein GlgB [Desulforhopalus singaporensis]|uniref:1,4-alpha-glucan branching enzyme GlgB n=1 Tax=Desulforhopalus singaporensis TaxID=91360 RepID=A0A1H0PES4_9BACT|nr:1,4-alpha-glucan branching protein GlgB [Desulforhopalus singaporensis]SDP03158.1 glycogen branching enzyme [Desulforhopalus singaporensis]